MKLHKIIAGICAAAFAVSSLAVTTASAEESTDGQIYGRAGIVWMIKDWWDHRNTIDLEPLDEYENNVISCTHTDVYITGNGQYEVILEGYHVEDDQIPFATVGTLGVQFDFDFNSYPDLTLTLDECTIDGVTYTIDEQPELEESDLGKVMKIKNAYGNNAVTTPEMDASVWTTTEPITIKFTVAGLDSDKIENNPDESLVKVYGNGSIDNDPSEDEVADTAESSENATVLTEDDSTISDTAVAEETVSDSTKAEVEETSGGWLIYGCIAGGVVVIIIVVALLAKKKK